MKTIFISLLSGVEAKGVLRSNIVSRLLEDHTVRVVLLLKSKERVDFYQQEYHHPNLIYEVIESYPFSWFNRFFEYAKHYLVRTRTLNLYKRLRYEDSHNTLLFLVSHLVSIVFANKFFRSISRFLDLHMAQDTIFDSFFRKYHPDVVFLANLFDEVEISILRKARHEKVPTIGFINSWDKVTSKGFVRLLPDLLIVTNMLVQKDAIQHVDMPAEKIIISGVPNYDPYIDHKALLSREQFFNTIKISPKKKLIVFGPIGKSISNSDWDAIDMVQEIINTHFSNEAALLVRFQPNDFGGDEEEFAKRPDLHFDIPGVRFSTTRGMDWDMTTRELDHLRNTLFHMSLLVSYASSLSIDAACFDKPIINIGFEVKENEPALKQPTRRFATEHYTHALNTGAITLVKSRDKLITTIREYLKHPEKDHEARTRLVQEQCYLLDGKAGKRIVEAIRQVSK